MKLGVYNHEGNRMSALGGFEIDRVSLTDDKLTVALDKDNIISLHKKIGEFIKRRWPDQIKASNDTRREDCISAVRRPGYDTILGYLAKEQPEILSLLEGAEKDGTLRDGFWLTNKCRQLGYSVIKVHAPEVLKNQGIEFVNAYPVSLLRERFEN